MSADFIARLVGMIVFGVFGAYLGGALWSEVFTQSHTLYVLVIGLLGGLAGLVLTPYITTRPMRALRSLLSRIDAQTLVAGLVGLIVGLVIAALLAFPLSLLPPPFGEILPFVGVLLVSYFGVAVFVMRQHDIFSILLSRWRDGGPTSYGLIREFVRELPHRSASAAWQRSVRLAIDTELDILHEPRIKPPSTDLQLKASHPFFWSGYILVDTGVQRE